MPKAYMNAAIETGDTSHKHVPGHGPSPRHDCQSGMPAAAPACCPSRRPASHDRVLDWVESQSRVTRIWLDQLIAEGDPDDLVSVIHRQAAWLDLMQERLRDA